MNWYIMYICDSYRNICSDNINIYSGNIIINIVYIMIC